MTVQDDLALADVYDYLRTAKNGHSIGREHLRKVRIMGFDGQRSPCTHNQSLLAYLVFETEHRGRRYVLSNEKWYQVDDAYLRGVEEALHAVPSCTKPVILTWPRTQRGGKMVHHEEDYNRQYAALPDFLVLDREPFRKFGRKHGRSQVEIADLFHLPTKKLLCVKRWNRSSTMSHLLAQGSVSAQLLRSLPGYTAELLRQVKARWPRHQIPADPKEFLHGVSFVYVIGTNRPPKRWNVDMLPVFTKVNMTKHIGTIQVAGFNVEIAPVHMT